MRRLVGRLVVVVIAAPAGFLPAAADDLFVGSSSSHQVLQ
jgi:hypothetical protein